MIIKNTNVFALALSILFISAGAFASDHASSATGRGPGGGEGGNVGAPQSCSFTYSIQKIGPTIAVENDDVVYYVFVSNVGNCGLKHINVKDVLPHDLTFVSATPTPTSMHGEELRWDDLEIKAGQYDVFEIQAKVDHHHHGASITNTACAFTPWIGIQICDAATTSVFDHPVETN